MPGYIYLATNPVMPGLTKIGFTESVLSERFAALQSTGVPMPFQLFAAFFVEDPRSCEKTLHGLLACVRLADNREFFRIEAKEALAKVSTIVLANVPANETSTISLENAFSDLVDDEQDILAAFTMAPSQQRPNDWYWLKRLFGMNELDAKHMLHTLRTKGYLKDRRGVGGAVLYDLAPRGVSFGRIARENPDYRERFAGDFFYQP